jgi:hypothetical protein
VVTRRRLIIAPLILGGRPTARCDRPASLGQMLLPQRPSTSKPSSTARAPIDAVALAELARARAALAANWLAGAQRPTGVFYYSYDPFADQYETIEYNEVRHAGTTYSFFQAYGLLGDESVAAGGGEGERLDSPEHGTRSRRGARVPGHTTWGHHTGWSGARARRVAGAPASHRRHLRG